MSVYKNVTKQFSSLHNTKSTLPCKDRTKSQLAYRLWSPKRAYCCETVFDPTSGKTVIHKTKELETDRIIQHWLDLKCAQRFKHLVQIQWHSASFSPNLETGVKQKTTLSKSLLRGKDLALTLYAKG